MSKLGRHERTIRLPDEEPWNLPPPQPEHEREHPQTAPARTSEPDRAPEPARR